MSPSDRDALFALLERRPRLSAEFCIARIAVLDLMERQYGQLCNMVNESLGTLVGLDKRLAVWRQKPTEEERDALIVQLRDVEKVKPKLIRRVLRELNPAWDMKPGAIRQAYCRAKKAAREAGSVTDGCVTKSSPKRR